MQEQDHRNDDAAGQVLWDALEGYRSRKRYESMARVFEDIADFLPGRQGERMSTRTVRRDINNNATIPNQRIEYYTEWLHTYAQVPRDQIALWLDQTPYPRPGELLVGICEAGGNLPKLYAQVRSATLPPLRSVLWGAFLNRDAELAAAVQWADARQPTIALLWGLGGNGKTTLQLKIGADFVYGPHCPLRWPFDAVVWASAQNYPYGRPMLADILYKILETFDVTNASSGFPRPFEWVRREADRLLREHRTLVLLDNFDTIAPKHRNEILAFFNHLHGSSQLLISSRYRFDRDTITHTLIPVPGLTPFYAQLLIQDYLTAKAIAPQSIPRAALEQLAEVTHYNPKIIVSLLGMVGQGMALEPLLDSLTQGQPGADTAFAILMDKAWQNLLSKTDRQVLMAKAFFSQPIDLGSLAQVAGVPIEKAAQAVAKLQAIAFLERPREGDGRLRAHPLAQDVARRILHEQPAFAQQAEQPWWAGYLPQVEDRARALITGAIEHPNGLDDDLINVADHLEHHLQDNTSFARQAAEVFARSKGISGAFRHLGRWNEVLVLGELALALAEQTGDIGLQARCCFVLGHNLSYHGFAAEAMLYLDRAHLLASRHGDCMTLGMVLQSLGYVHWERAQLDQALMYLEESLTCLEQYPTETGPTCNSMGLVYMGRGDHQTAIHWFEQALAIETKQGNQKGLATIQQNLLVAYTKQGDFVRGMEYGWRSFGMAIRSGYLPLTQLILTHIGVCYGSVGDSYCGLRCIEAGILHERAITSPYVLGWSLCHSAILRGQRGDLQAAEQLYLNGLAIFRTIKLTYGLATFAYRLVELFISQQRYVEAQAHIAEAVTNAEQLGNPEHLVRARLAALQLQAYMGISTPTKTIAHMHALQSQYQSNREQAAIAYAIWQFDPFQAAAHERAAELYHVLYADAPRMDYRQRYLALTGVRLPDGPALPPLPSDIPSTLAPIAELVARAQQVLAQYAQLMVNTPPCRELAAGSTT